MPFRPRVLQFAAIFSSWTFLLSAEGGSRSATERTDPSPPATTCDAITINYITHSLPQSCLTNTWASSEPPSTRSTGNIDANGDEIDVVSSTSSVETLAPDASSDSGTDSHGESVDGAAKPFMSFEDWKEMMLRETGQDPQDLRSRNANQQRGHDRTPPDMGHAGLGEEDEISLNFDSYLDNKAGDQREHTSGSNPANAGEHGVGDPVAYEDGRPSIHRSKDAGKTCKERFSYSSFDAGATVLKSGPSAKNAKAILVENKDSYMLLECSARQKFVIVELSDDILIDTVVLANFEFFSSMIRHFRISVSDRYPVKTDRWRELGTFEARNSRDIQPFLVENPQIWAKYVQIEFLTHYGNEYYCPVSLLRVHGSRMLDSWKDTEAGRDEEQPLEDEPEPYAEIQSGEAVSTSEHRTTERQPTPDASIANSDRSHCTVMASIHLFAYPSPTCAASLNHTSGDSLRDNDPHSHNPNSDNQTPPDPAEGRGTVNSHVTKTESLAVDGAPAAPPTTASPSEQPQVTSISSTSDSPSLVVDTAANSTVQVTSTRAAPISDSPSSSISTAPISKAPASAASGSKNRTSGATGPPVASQPVQEGFFKAITKRLQQVESNLTLSLKYVEDQARHLQETLQRTEQKQISKVNLFLENLNQTVLAELRNVRDQYDQIWQSTVIALESQRDQSQREIVALSSRLNLLADEVVFQKRMAIVQAVLLLSCLILVIFSRGVSLPYLAPFMDQTNGPPYDSTASPSAFARARGLYGPTFSATRSDTVPYNAHQDVDYMPVTSVAQNSPTSSSQLREQYSAEEQAALLQCERLSPPQTPNPAHDLSMPDMLAQPRESQPPVLRHPSSKQQSNVRKPLPALPENPSSP
jgi:hypothetical protein